MLIDQGAAGLTINQRHLGGWFQFCEFQTLQESLLLSKATRANNHYDTPPPLSRLPTPTPTTPPKASVMQEAGTLRQEAVVPS